MAITPERHWSARRYAETASFVPELGAPVLELLAPSAGERILDPGCGDDVLTEKIVAAGATVVVVDAADGMVAAARARGIDARVVRGQNLTFDTEFDAVFRMRRCIGCARRKPSSPVSGGHSNPGAALSVRWAATTIPPIVVALSAVLGRRGRDAHQLSPWYFPSAAAYRKKLEDAGFSVEEIRIVPRPTALPTSIEPWLDTFAQSFLGALPELGRSSARAEVADLLRPVLMDETVTWVGDYVRLRFRATLLA